jgi:type VI secretion system protein VasG
MIDLNLKALLGRLNPTCATTLSTAAALCIGRGHYEISPEHHIEVLLDEADADVVILCERFGVDIAPLRRALQEQLSSLRSGNPGKPVFSPLLVEWYGEAWLLGSIEQGLTTIRSGLLLLALLVRAGRYSSPAVARALSRIPRDVLREDLLALAQESVEHPAEGPSEPLTPGEPDVTKLDRPDGALARFTQDLTALASGGLIDPVFGRDQEVRQMVDILSRRRKNNPILVGDPGVGKTAVVEGLAMQLAQGHGPQSLQGVRLLSLDLGALQAGAGVKGEFEARLRSVIQEVRASPIPIILFVDEAHTLIGAGGSEGGSDAANLLKPALARGELRTIAATTWKEYKKYFEKDPALARRFELVQVPEPSPAQAIVMLRGVAARYAASHQVHIRDDAVVAAVELSHRYLTGRQLPDKAVGLLDTCAARIRVAQSAPPALLEGYWRKAEQLERELAANQADLRACGLGVPDRAEELRAQIDEHRAAAESLAARWNEEKELVQRVLSLRGSSQADLGATEREELTRTLHQLQTVQGERPLVFPEVSTDTVASVISEWTGIPVGRMVRDEAQAVLRFEEELGGRIKGQDHALALLGERIRQAKAGLGEPSQPLGVFLLVGPSGVGKTETALGLADMLYGGESSVITINMSEFKDKSTVNRLIGSPPGYVGYGEGGKLTESVRQRPYSVVLLDECEKADGEVLELFYQVFDKGVLSDGEGREVNFRNTIVLLTSNLASHLTADLLARDPTISVEGLLSHIRPTLSRHLQPALLARMTVVPYLPLSPVTLAEIARLKLTRLARRVQESHDLDLSWDDAVLETIVARCTDVETGARNVDHILRGSVLPLLSSQILSHLGDASAPKALRLTLSPQGSLTLTP